MNHQTEILTEQRMCSALAVGFELGPIACALLPSLLRNVKQHRWQYARVDQLRGGARRDKGSAVSALMRRGVIILGEVESAESGTALPSAFLTGKSLDLLIAANPAMLFPA